MHKPVVGKLYQKKALIEVIEVLPNGNVVVRNPEIPDDLYTMSSTVFEQTYVEASEKPKNTESKKAKRLWDSSMEEFVVATRGIGD